MAENYLLSLADLKGKNNEQVTEHIRNEYCHGENIVFGTFIVAYESVGDWGCDSTSYFLFYYKGKLFEVFGSHCSCFGFEDQWKPDETSFIALIDRIEKGYLFSTGGYDNSSDENILAASNHVKKLYERYKKQKGE